MRLAALLVLVALALAGCGGQGGKSEHAVRDTVNQFTADIGRNDYTAACPLTTGPLRSLCGGLRAEARVLPASKCAQADPETELGQMCSSMHDYAAALGAYRGLAISKVAISDSAARVTFRGSSQVMSLSKIGGRWLISSVTLTPPPRTSPS